MATPAEHATIREPPEKLSAPPVTDDTLVLSQLEKRGPVAAELVLPLANENLCRPASRELAGEKPALVISSIKSVAVE